MAPMHLPLGWAGVAADGFLRESGSCRALLTVSTNILPHLWLPRQDFYGCLTLTNHCVHHIIPVRPLMGVDGCSGGGGGTLGVTDAVFFTSLFTAHSLALVFFASLDQDG